MPARFLNTLTFNSCKANGALLRSKGSHLASFTQPVRRSVLEFMFN